MKPELRAKILAYNKTVAERAEKANDLDIIIAEIMKLPPGQLKKVLTDGVLAVLAKYGVDLN
jgi:hypothetical protein